MYRKKVLDDTLRKLKQDNLAVDGEMMIGRGADEVLGPEVYYSCYKENF